MIKTKCLYDQPDESDGHRILTTRLWPRGKTKAALRIFVWMKEVSPSKALLNDWKHKSISWAEYVARYRDEMASQKTSIEKLATLARKGTITLLCYEREGDRHCHRYLLKTLIENQGRSTNLS